MWICGAIILLKFKKEEFLIIIEILLSYFLFNIMSDSILYLFRSASLIKLNSEIFIKLVSFFKERFKGES